MSEHKKTSTNKLSDNIQRIQQKKGLPPVHMWHPEVVMDIDITITRDGSWYYENSKIERHKIVKLFSTVLRLDEDGYCLVTPVEKCRIKVDDAPFIATELNVEGEANQQKLTFTTNCDELVIADKDHQITVNINDATNEPAPYIHIRSNLNALISRNVYYQLVELAVEEVIEGKAWIGVWSNGVFFKIGTLD